MTKLTRNLVLVGLLAGGAVAALAVADGPGKASGGNQPAAGAAGEREGPRWGKRGGPRRSLGDMLERQAQELGLTAQQLQSIQAAEQAARPELDKLFQAVRDQRQAQPGNPEQLAAAHKALQTRREALQAQIDGILTAEQRTKLQQLREQRRGKDGHRGHRPEDGAGAPTPAKPPTE
jgi:periplasmic protein CpxP/Spy